MTKWTCTRCGLEIVSDKKPEERKENHRHTFPGEESLQEEMKRMMK
jgi:hypothetical protein